MLRSISAAISTYNAGRYIQDCLDSVVNQSFNDLEIICIDDASTDDTLSILNDYASKDKRIIVVAKKKNEGLAVSRNEALSLAQGKYIAFIDGDDLYHPDLFRKAYDCAERNASDMVIWDYVTFRKKEDIETGKTKNSSLLSLSPLDKISLLQRPAFIWVKLLRTEVLRSMNVSFPAGLTRQDIPVHWKLITQIDSISLLPERLSYYRQQSEATTRKSDRRLFDLAAVMDIVKDYLVESGLYGVYKNEFLRQQLGLLHGMVDFIDNDLKAEAHEMLMSRLGEDQWDYIRGKNELIWQKRDFYLALDGSVPAKLRRFCWLTARRVYRLFWRKYLLF